MNADSLILNLNDYPNFKYDDKQSGYKSGEYFWKATTLYDAVKEQGIKKSFFDLRSMAFDVCMWDCQDLADFICHYERIQNADTSIPIIVSPYGRVMDGYHRVVKRLLIDREVKIPCYRLKEMPEADVKPEDD